eukprot:5788139-Amphidinium_carterae.1
MAMRDGTHDRNNKISTKESGYDQIAGDAITVRASLLLLLQSVVPFPFHMPLSQSFRCFAATSFPALSNLPSGPYRASIASPNRVQTSCEAQAACSKCTAHGARE